MAQLPNPWISNSVDAPVSTDTAVAMRPPPVPATVELLPASTGGPQEAPASAPSKNPGVGVLAKCNCEYAHCDDFDRPDCRAKAAGLDPWPDGATDCIHEIFHWVRKLMKQPPRFVLDEAAFMADVEEVPLFIREDGYLRRQA